MDDGLADLVVVEHASLLVTLSGVPKLRSGAFTKMRQVQYSHAKTATFTAETPQLVELDGDVVGTTPARFEVAPARLTVVAG